MMYTVIANSGPFRRGNNASRLKTVRIKLLGVDLAWVVSKIPQDRAQWCAVTLTCKQTLKTAPGQWRRVSPETLSKAIKVFLKRLNLLVYRNAYRRGYKKLDSVTSLEWGSSGRLHAHLLLEIPEHLRDDPQPYLDSVTRLWSELEWAQERNEAKRVTSVFGWTKYILKETSWRPDALDVANTTL